MTTAKLTPKQNFVLGMLRNTSYRTYGLPIESVHKATLGGLERRGLAVVKAGRVYATRGA